MIFRLYVSAARPDFLLISNNSAVTVTFLESFGDLMMCLPEAGWVF